MILGLDLDTVCNLKNKYMASKFREPELKWNEEDHMFDLRITEFLSKAFYVANRMLDKHIEEEYGDTEQPKPEKKDAPKDASGPEGAPPVV